MHFSRITVLNYKDIMLRFLGIIIILNIAIWGKAQNYTPFDFDNGNWVCHYYTKQGIFVTYANDYVHEVVRFYCNGDTILNDVNYKKLYYVGYAAPTMSPATTISGYYCGIRNDVENKKVFLSNYPYAPLYDFNLNYGDSITYRCSGNPAPILSIDSVLYCSTYHKRYNYLDEFYGILSFWVEGIGSSDGLIPVNCMTAGGLLECYSESNNVVCDTCPVFTGNGILKPLLLSVYPNPTSGILFINNNLKIQLAEFALYDYSGKLVSSGKPIDDRIDLTNFHPGLYVLKIGNYSFRIIKI